MFSCSWYTVYEPFLHYNSLGQLIDIYPGYTVEINQVLLTVDHRKIDLL